jgi:biotin-dependent carboxylase-like uncharacterized protein
MSTAVLHIERVGPLVTVQDGGRPRLMRFGVPASGPMDRFAHAAANMALGRPIGSTAIEVSLGGLGLCCSTGSVTVAVCGGEFDVHHGAERCTPWTVRTLRRGETFTIAPGHRGSWCYLAVAGDIRADRWLGSTATHVRANLGGGVLQPGTDLVIDNAIVDDARDGAIEAPQSRRPASVLRVVLGPQSQCFQRDAADLLLGSTFAFTTAYDRMGVRLDGPVLGLDDALAIPSSPIVRGSIQVAGDGVATLLFADHQTTGGYPKIATVIADDASAAAQLRAGDTVTFRRLDPAESVLAARAAAALQTRDLAAIAERPGLLTRRLLGANLVGGVFHHDDNQHDRR